MGGFQPQAFAICELQEMGLELWKLSGFFFFLLLFFFLLSTSSEGFMKNK